MKTLIVLAGLLSASASFAYTPDLNFPSNPPSESDWAIGMVKSACHLNLNTREHFGAISKLRSGEVLYRVFNQRGVLVAAAKARSTSLFAKKTCVKR